MLAGEDSRLRLGWDFCGAQQAPSTTITPVPAAMADRQHVVCCHRLSGDQHTVPIEECLRSDRGGNLPEDASNKLLGLGGQTPSLVVGVTKPFVSRSIARDPRFPSRS
jgi:hypothetical protein